LPENEQTLRICHSLTDVRLKADVPKLKLAWKIERDGEERRKTTKIGLEKIPVLAGSNANGKATNEQRWEVLKGKSSQKRNFRIVTNSNRADNDTLFSNQKCVCKTEQETICKRARYGLQTQSRTMRSLNKAMSALQCLVSRSYGLDFHCSLCLAMLHVYTLFPVQSSLVICCPCKSCGPRLRCCMALIHGRNQGSAWVPGIQNCAKFLYFSPEPR